MLRVRLLANPLDWLQTIFEVLFYFIEIVEFSKMKLRLLAVLIVLSSLAIETLSQSGSKIKRKIQRWSMESMLPKCCENDYPHCNEPSKRGNKLAVDGAVFDVKKDGEEILYVFYGDYVLGYAFKDDARMTPIKTQPMGDVGVFKIKEELNWNAGDQVQYVVHAGKDDMIFGLTNPNAEDKSKVNRKKKLSGMGEGHVGDPEPWETDEKHGKLYTGAFMAAHGEEGSLLAFYRDVPQAEEGSGGEASEKKDGNISIPEPFDYTIKLWNLRDGSLYATQKVKGRIVAVAGRSLEPFVGDLIPPSRGIYFTNDGRACWFELAHPEDGKVDLDIERPNDKDGNRAPCSSFNVYLGCPVSYCYQGDVDDIAYHKGNYYVFYEKFFWQVKWEKYKLPMKAPTIKEKLYIDRDTNGFPYPQGMEVIDAAFHYEEGGKEIMYTMKEDIVKYYVNGEIPFTDTDVLKDVFVGAPENTIVDTAIYDDVSKKLLMFFGQRWGYFVRKENTINEWELEGELRNKTTDFTEVPTYFEGSVDTKDHLYFTVGSFYYSLRKNDESPSSRIHQVYASVVQKDSTDGIFNAMDCQLGAYKEIVEKVLDFKPKFYKPQLMEQTKEEETSQVLEIVLVLIGTILVVAFILLLGGFLLIGRKKKGKKQGKGKGLKLKGKKTK